MVARKFLLMLAVLALLLPLAGVSAQGGAIEVNQTVEGTAANEVVTYRLALEAGQTVSIVLASEDFDAYLRVKDADDFVLAEDDDSGGALNSALLFTAPESGTYIIEISAFGGPAQGAFTLTTAEAEVVEISYDSATKVMFDGTGAIQNFVFSGSAGDVINLYTDNPDLDLYMTLYDEAGAEVAYDDDSGGGFAPSIRRIVLPADGTYRVALSGYSVDVSGVTMLHLETDELPLLESGPFTAAFDDEYTTERLGLNVVEGQRYLIELTMDGPANGNIEIMLDPEVYDSVNLSFNAVMSASAMFESTVTGLVTVEISDYSWLNPTTTYTVTVTPAD
ncbi:MAG: hypothetical protein Kow0077_15020 [Anaerolineae bacterium]